ncbi:hypothetical protein [Lacticaseibacillus camelliae]|uniref:hypothetical protein n=1 Tax=Lacticaseibacillus camelliae TaxID=381742 RepID=UPI0012E1F933|nr:hypothetical protein [Lacticaseibacillus camelliae]
MRKDVLGFAQVVAVHREVAPRSNLIWRSKPHTRVVLVPGKCAVRVRPLALIVERNGIAECRGRDVNQGRTERRVQLHDQVRRGLIDFDLVVVTALVAVLKHQVSGVAGRGRFFQVVAVVQTKLQGLHRATYFS